MNQKSQTYVFYNVEAATVRNVTYTSSSVTITITKAGRYFIYFTFMSESNESPVEIGLRINGVQYRSYNDAINTYEPISVNVILDLSENNTVACFQNTQKIHAQNGGTFGGYLIG